MAAAPGVLTEDEDCIGEVVREVVAIPANRRVILSLQDQVEVRDREQM